MSDYYQTSRGRSSTPTRVGERNASSSSSAYLTRPIHDTNFTEMLNRTRNNINRISQKYSTDSIEPYSDSRRALSNGSQRDFSASRQLLATSHHQPTPAMPALPPPPPTSQNIENDPNHNIANLSKYSAFDFEELMNRIARLEKESDKKHRLEDRIVKLENANENLRATVENLTTENKEMRKEISKLQNQVNSHHSTLEILQHDVDSRRSTISKMDSWVRQGETWRNDIENQLSEMNSQIKLVNRIIAENKDTIQERVTRNDLDTFRDRMNMTTQQTVLASLSNWNDKIELTVRHLERQVAALRIGATVNNSNGDSGYTGITLSDDDVKRALMTQQPSEILLKGVVSSEIRAMENDLEKKMELHLSASLRSLLHESQREVREDMRVYLRQLVLASDLSGDAIRSPQRKSRDHARDQDDERDETVVTLGKYHAARREKERELQHFADKMDDISSVIVALQEASESREKSFGIELRALERRLEECVTISAAYVTTMQTRYGELEKTLQEREERMRSKHRDLEDELMKGLRENNEISSTERVELNKRMALLEKMVEGVMERVDMSQNIFEGLFSTSPEIKRFQSAAIKLEGLLVEFTSLRGDVREISANYNQVQSIFAKKEEISEIRERLAHVEPLSRKIDDLAASLRAAQEKQSSSSHEILTLNAAVESIKSSAAVVTDRVSRLENSNQILSKESKEYSDRIERQHDQKVESMEQLLRKELQAVQNQVNQLQTNFQNQLTQQSNSNHSSQTQIQNTIQSIQTKIQGLQSTSEVQVDKFDYLQQTVKEIKGTLPRLETNLLSHQKEVNNLQYEHSKNQLERESTNNTVKEIARKLLDLESKLQELQSEDQVSTTSTRVTNDELLINSKKLKSVPEIPIVSPPRTSKSLISPPFLSSPPPSSSKTKGVITPDESSRKEKEIFDTSNSSPTKTPKPSTNKEQNLDDVLTDKNIDSSLPISPNIVIPRRMEDSIFKNNFISNTEINSSLKEDEDNTAMRDFDDSSFDSTPASSPVKETPTKSGKDSRFPDLDSSFQSTPLSTPIRDDQKTSPSKLPHQEGDTTPQSSPTRIVRDVLKLDDSDDSANNIESFNNTSIVSDHQDPADDSQGDSNIDDGSSFGDIEVLEDHDTKKEMPPLQGIRQIVTNPSDGDSDNLSSIESSPIKPATNPTLSGIEHSTLAAERTQTFLETLDNSFDESSDFDFSPKKPLITLPDDSLDAENSNETADKEQTHDIIGTKEDKIGESTKGIDDSSDLDDENSHEDQHLDISSSDDDTEPEIKMEKHETPGKIPKSNSSTFSKQLEDVVGSYWEGKGHEDKVPSPESTPAAVEPTSKRVLDHSDSALYQLSDSESDSDWDADPPKETGTQDSQSDNENTDSQQQASTSGLPPLAQLRIGASGSRNPSAISSDEDSPFAQSLAGGSHISSSSPENSPLHDSAGHDDEDDDSDSDDGIPTLGTLSPVKTSPSASSVTPSITSGGDLSSTSGLSIRERLKLRQEALHNKDKSDDFSLQKASSVQPVAPAQSDDDSDSDGTSSVDEVNKFVAKEKNFFDFDDDDEDNDEDETKTANPKNKDSSTLAATSMAATSSSSLSTKPAIPPLKLGGKTPENDPNSPPSPSKTTPSKKSLQFATKNFKSSDSESDDDDDDDVIPPIAKGPSSVRKGLQNISKKVQEKEDMVTSFDEDFDY